MSDGFTLPLDDALQLLPLTATASWPDGVWHDTLIARPNIELLIFAPRGTDHQSPHSRDEAYIVARGTAVLELDGARHPLGPGDMAWVPAHAPHRFIEISDDFATWAVFVPQPGPSETS